MRKPAATLSLLSKLKQRRAVMQAADRQGGELADAQRQVAALESELEAKAREGSALLADNLALKVRAAGTAWSRKAGSRPVVACYSFWRSLAHPCRPLAMAHPC